MDLPDDDLSALIKKYQVGLKYYLETYKADINSCISSSGSHASISKIARLVLKNTIVYDQNSSSSFYCNIKNIIFGLNLKLHSSTKDF